MGEAKIRMIDIQQQKAAKMADVKKHMKNYSSVGRKCRDGKEAQLVRACPVSVLQKLLLSLNGLIVLLKEYD